jgi:adenylate cyclase class 2
VKPSHETEIKLRAGDPAKLKRQLHQLGFRVVKRRHFESNHLFDFADGGLRRAGCALRLRFADGKSLLTFKAKAVATSGYKVRPETETEVEDGRQLWKILEGMGFGEAFRYEKYRTTYSRQQDLDHYRNAELVHDETPIGDFIELEGPKRWIDVVAQQLGYTLKDYIAASYVRLYYEECERLGKRPGHMVFPPRRKS